MAEFYLEDLDLNQIMEFEHLDLDSYIDDEEIKRALFQMPKGKVTDIDGFPAEFYVEFYDELQPLICQVIKTVAKEGFPEEMMQSIIALIEKSNKDLLNIAHWRPLSLLCVDFKIYTKIIANQIYKVSPNIIHEDQTGFIPKRGLCDNVFDLINAIDYCNAMEIKAILVSFDFEKAFDSVEYKVLFDIMHAMNFAEIFIDMVKKALQGATSYTMNKGYTGNKIQITRGLRQGDPQSAPLFDLVAEVIVQKIRQNKNIHGIEIFKDQEPKKLGQYVDDLWALVKAD